MAKHKKIQKPLASAKFKVGDSVRVKNGIRIIDYPDIPLGGWAGTIVEVHKDGSCTVKWSRETLAVIHPVVKKRTEKDGTDHEHYWMDEDDLVPDQGGPLRIEQPKMIATKPLSPKDQDDRIRMIFGLSSNDQLPDVDDETLEIYHDYLSNNLQFPFHAIHGAEYGHPERAKIIDLGNPDDEPMIDDKCGLLCNGRIESESVVLALSELEEAKPNRQLVDDYRYWFWNYR